MTKPEFRKTLAAGELEIEFTVNSVPFRLIRVEPGEFVMGSPPSEEGHQEYEARDGKVRISKAFYLGRYEINQAQYRAVTNTNPSLFQGDDLPIDELSFSDALTFCRELSERLGVKVTLPTEAQWEFACRAGTQTRFYSGDTIADLDRVAWYVDNSGETIHPVGQKEPNAWGFYDMLGNVWEFCRDSIESNAEVAALDPTGTFSARSGSMRGGGYLHEAEYARCASSLLTDDRFGGAGIRIAIVPGE